MGAVSSLTSPQRVLLLIPNIPSQMERTTRIHEHVLELRKISGYRLRAGELAGTGGRRRHGSRASSRSNRLRTFVLHCRASGETRECFVQQVTVTCCFDLSLVDHRLLDPLGHAIPAEKSRFDRSAITSAC